ncbi:unnamed protein product [Durusdinium trenchii]|uniref:Uncharacterized protein n=1 Tax=Durusdinium trenchii TaxID=1381693 RepID=A0ABP0JK40_9DINO
MFFCNVVFQFCCLLPQVSLAGSIPNLGFNPCMSCIAGALSAIDSWSHHHIVFFLQYFVVALAQSLPLSALGLILQIDLDGRAHPEEVNTFYANALLVPALFKPMPGLLSDSLRLRGIGRRPVLVFIQILWCAALVQAANSRSRSSYFVFYSALALCCGAAEAVLDGASVELMQELELSGAEVQATSFAFKTAGSLVARMASPLTLAAFSSHHTAAKVCVVAPLAAVGISMCASFPAIRRADRGASSGVPWCWQSGVLAGAFFLFIRGAVPTEEDTFASFISTKVSGVWVGIRNASGSLGGFAALCCFQALPVEITKNLRLTILITTCQAVLVGGGLRLFLSTVDLSSFPWLYALCTALGGAADSLAFLPNLAICADCAPKDFGALGFAVLSLFLDLGDQVSSRLAALLTEAYHIGNGKDGVLKLSIKLVKGPLLGSSWQLCGALSPFHAAPAMSSASSRLWPQRHQLCNG